MVENTYLVKAYLEVYHPTDIGTRIGDCEVGFENSRYFLSKTISCDSREEAEERGKRRIGQVLSTLSLYTGVSYRIDHFSVDQISGNEPHLHTSELLFERMTLLPLRNGVVTRVEKTLRILGTLQDGKPAEIVERAINYFLRGCRLEEKEWRSESFLNFYKVTELLAQAYRKEFSQAFSDRLKNTLFELNEKEIQTLVTQTRIIRFMCKQLDVSDDRVPQIVKLRATFSAHATIDEPAISNDDFNICKILASNSLINYIEKHNQH
jgi:hypothetical protein